MAAIKWILGKSWCVCVETVAGSDLKYFYFSTVVALSETKPIKSQLCAILMALVPRGPRVRVPVVNSYLPFYSRLAPFANEMPSRLLKPMSSTLSGELIQNFMFWTFITDKKYVRYMVPASLSGEKTVSYHLAWMECRAMYKSDLYFIASLFELHNRLWNCCCFHAQCDGLLRI